MLKDIKMPTGWQFWLISLKLIITFSCDVTIINKEAVHKYSKHNKL